LGPGLLFASTAIGVSHLVQSTRAGALFGFGLLAFIVAANVFKYPFFEFGSRYASSTGTSIIDGYRKIGKWMLWLYCFITISTMFFVTAAIGAVTAGFLDHLFGIHEMLPVKSFHLTVLVLFVVCLSILTWGKYKALDGLIKIIGSVLLITTIVAFVLVLKHGPVSGHVSFLPLAEEFQLQHIGFVVALMGWMPTAVDMSSWNSLWTVARIEQTGYKPTLKQTLLEFNLGYWISAVLAICFVTFGAYLLFHTGTTMSDKSHEFAAQVVSLYTRVMGDWSFYVIGPAAFCIMFGTSIAVLDGYGRALERTWYLLKKDSDEKEDNFNRNRYALTLWIVGLGALLIIFFFGSSMKFLVDLATTLSFIIAPIIAIANYKLVTGKFTAIKDQPGKPLRLLAILGIGFLTLLSIGFIVFKIWEAM
jgi:Mn2+/Fe2+ NRAMP family transporter